MEKRKKSGSKENMAKLKRAKKDGQDLIQFVLEYVIEHDVVDISVASFWADHANDIKTTNDAAQKIQEWMKFVKEKIGTTTTK